jgi:formate hydrogenlyase subunit 3/multisubunit Na+/H+ antiporter MnhD subunit
MRAADLLLVASVAAPLLLAACCVSDRLRKSAASFLVFAPLPALLAAVLAPEGHFVQLPAPLRLKLQLDGPGAILLGSSALLWSAAGAYVKVTMGTERATSRFSVWWLLTLSGSLGVFIAADVIGFYLLFSLASLAAYGLIVHEQTATARRAGQIYLSLAVLGEAFLLLALVMLAAGSAEVNPQIRDVVRELGSAPARSAVVASLVLGLGLKMGLVPLHVWLPLAHPAAPVPASAVLSGVLVKAGVVGFLRFLPFETGLPGWGIALMVIGLLTAYWGALVGVTQKRPKVILAYSTVSQMGLLSVLAGVGLEAGEPELRLLTAYYAVHHTLVKGALFLALGVLGAMAPGRPYRLAFATTCVLALSLGGMPLTSGALAKLAAKPMIGSGVVESALSLAAVGSTLLMLRFLTVAACEPPGARPVAGVLGLVVPWAVVATASLAVPWSLYPAISGESVVYLLSANSIWKVAWPVLVGAAAMLLVRRITWLPGWVPEGDIVVFGKSAEGLVRTVGSFANGLDQTLRRWQMAGLSLVLLTILLVAAIAGGE